MTKNEFIEWYKWEYFVRTSNKKPSLKLNSLIIYFKSQSLDNKRHRLFLNSGSWKLNAIASKIKVSSAKKSSENEGIFIT